jgi:hypothetical protein
VVIVGLLVTLLLTLRSHHSDHSAADDVAHNFVAAVNAHDVSGAQALSCRDFTAKVKKLTDEVRTSHARLSVQNVRPTTKGRQQAVLRAAGSVAVSGDPGATLAGVMVFDIEPHQGLWLICSQVADVSG